MRQIVLDTETTGLDPSLGHRIIEVAAIEMFSRQITDRNFHRYVNPEREIDQGALDVHGISGEFLADKPKFREVANDFLEFVEGAELIIHNAPFDVAFLDHELEQLGLKPIGHYCPVITDTLRMAKGLHPGKRNSLDALCERYLVDNSARSLHGALLDARLLAEVYLSMTRGQESLLMEVADPAGVSGGGLDDNERVELLVVRPDDAELESHAAQIEAIDKASKGACIWKKLGTASGGG
ncbi:MAG: DNA polymerase III subunit epsilon [Burkholderiales bacterium]